MKKIIAMTVVVVFGITFLALAESENVKVESTSNANNPTEDPTVREAILKTIEQHIKAQEVEGIFLLYDAVMDELLQLKFEKLHTGVVTKGQKICVP